MRVAARRSVLLVYAGFVVEKYLVWTYTHFVLTDRRVISRSGIVSKRGTEIPLERINNIDFHQRICVRVDRRRRPRHRVRGQGRAEPLRQRPPPRHGPAGDLPADGGERAPSGVAGRARPADGRRLRAPTAVPVHRRPDVTDQIAKLAALRDQGHITPEEYDAKKAELLERM